MAEKTSAEKRPVGIFRQVHHWPVILRDCIEEATLDPAWVLKTDPLKILQTADAESNKWAVQEFNYFHDTIQEFLYARSDGSGKQGKAAFTLYERNDIQTIDVAIGKRTHTFRVERLTLHVFDTSPCVAILTLETLHQRREDDATLSLADVQTLIDHMRRSYAPYWEGQTPGRCPTSVTIRKSGENAFFPISENRELTAQSAFKVIEKDRRNDAPIFEHWRVLAGLRLNGCEEICEWRDPSDERIPVMSFIALLPIGSETPRRTMQKVKEEDWVRLADAEQSGTGWPYNREFLRDLEKRAYYDRFFPDDHQREDVATRHIFGGAHYCLVSVTQPQKSFDVARDMLQAQFRRHYTQMSLCVRLEMAILLGFSRRAALAAAKLQEDPAKKSEFAKRVIDLHRDFLVFVSRFRFTGVSSQIQGQEMFDRWRESLGLRALYDDVRTELEATAAYVRTDQEKRRADAADKLNTIAFWIAGIALVVGLMATPIWSVIMQYVSGCKLPTPGDDCKRSAEYLGLSVVVVPAALWGLFRLLQKFDRNVIQKRKP